MKEASRRGALASFIGLGASLVFEKAGAEPAGTAKEDKILFMKEAVSNINKTKDSVFMQLKDKLNLDMFGYVVGQIGGVHDNNVINGDVLQNDSLGNLKNGENLPHIVPFGDWDYYYLDGPLSWVPRAGQSLKPVTVPKGFVTDLTSIPSVFWSVLPPTGRYAYAAIIHDYLYWTQKTSKEDADDTLKSAMEDSHVSWWKVNTIYDGVKYGGGSAWRQNALLKASGEKRLLQKFPDDKLLSWTAWKATPGVFQDEPAI